MGWKLWAAIAAFSLLMCTAYESGYHSAKLKGDLAMAEFNKDLADAKDAAREAAQTKQTELSAQLEKMDNEHAQAMGDLQRSAAADRAESDGLRSKLAGLQDRLRRTEGGTAAAGFQPTTGTRAAMVLSDLLSSCSADRSELAGAFDRSRARGLAVEARYELARGQ